MVNMRRTVALCAVLGCAIAAEPPVKETSQSEIVAPTSTTEPIEATTEAAPSTETDGRVSAFSWEPTTTEATHATPQPMFPKVESSEASLDTPTTSASVKDWGTTGQMSPESPQTESSEAALATPTSKSFVYEPSSSQPAFTWAPTSAAEESSPVYTWAPTTSAEPSPQYTWAPTTEAEKQQPAYTYAPSSSSEAAAAIVPVASSSSSAAAVIAPIPVASSSSVGNVPNFYTGPPAPSTEAATQAHTASPAPSYPASVAYASPALEHSASSLAAPPAYITPSAAPYNTASPSLTHTNTAPFTIAPEALTSAAATTLATKVSSCPPEDTSCKTVFIMPKPATETQSSVSTDDGLLVYNGHTMTMAAATLAAAPTKNAVGSAASSGGVKPSGTAKVYQGAAGKVDVRGWMCASFVMAVGAVFVM